MFHLKRLIATFFLFVLLFASSFVLLTVPRVSGQSNNSILRVTLVVPPNSLNELSTVSATSGYQIGDLEYTGLYPTLFPNGSADWQQSATDLITHNSNYTEWMFHVKPGLRWSDGTNVTANDILATFGPKFAFNSSYDIWGIGPEVSREYALNTSTAVFDLNITDAHFIDKANIQTFLPLYPASFVNTQGASSVDFGTDVGLGPFYVSNYVAGQFQMVMLRNPYFYTTGLPEPQISQIDINFVESLSLTSTNLLSGSSDLAPVELSNVPAILRDQNLKIIDQKGWQITSLEYNDSMYPYNMTAFRQALAFGINQSQLVNQADNGYGLTAYNSEGIESAAANLWYNPNIAKYDFNQSNSLSLLRSIGITKGSDNLLHYPNGSAVSLSLWTDSDNTADAVGASIVQHNLQNMGFSIHLVTTSAANLVGDYTNGVNGIRSAIILFTALAYIPALPFIQSFPAWNTIWLPTLSNPYWLYPPNINDEYKSNYTAFISTDNFTLDHAYFSNIQALNAEYLPTLILAYPDIVYAYNAQTWTNWPTNGVLDFHGGPWNFTAFATLTPVGATTSATSTSSLTSSSLTSSSAVSSSSSSSQSVSTSTTTQLSSSSVVTAPSSSASAPAATNYTLVAAVVVVIVIIAGIVAFLLRRRP